ncbi:MAG: FtsX-like permease family protein [Pseudomonadota bacterium]
MEIRPILSTLLRNRTGAILIALQIALTMAVIINSAFIIVERSQTMARPTGVDAGQIVLARAVSVGADLDVRSIIDADVRALLEIEGVENATKLSTMPLSNSGSNSGYHLTSDNESPAFAMAYYQGDINLLDTLGVTVTSGRWFTPDEIVYDPADGEVPSAVLLSDAMAKEAFEEVDPVGKFIYTATGQAIEVIGTYDQMSRPWYNWGDFYNTGIFPHVELNFMYAVRVAPGRADELVPVIEKALADIDNDRLVAGTRTMDEMVKRTYQRDVAMNRMLTIVMALVVFITALGIVGLASFSVAQRKRQIGTRRAIGAQKFHILRYFLVENWLITTAGIVLGLLLSFAINSYLVVTYNFAKLDPLYVPLVVLGLWGVGLLATLGPARSAMRVDPAIATRNI